MILLNCFFGINIIFVKFIIFIFCKIYYFYVAQIRGGFINWDLDYLRKWVVGEKLRCAPIAQIRGEFINWDLDYLRKWVVV
jgi:hypothetical protein